MNSKIGRLVTRPQTMYRFIVAIFFIRAGRDRQKVHHFWELMADGKGTYRSLYKSLEIHGKNPLRDATDALDTAVCKAYGFDPNDDRLTQLYNLNQALAEEEAEGQEVRGPGLPSEFANKKAWVTEDRITPES